MKKVITFAIILLTAGTVSAQTYFNNDRADYDLYYEAKYGFELSGNLSTATRGSNFNTANIAGFTAGFHLDIPVAYPLSVVPAILFTQKGYSASTTYGNFTQRTQSVDIPVLGKFKSGKSLNFFLGPQISYLISNSNQFNESFTPSERSTYQYNGTKLRFQGVAGLGFDVSRTVSLHGRYVFDVTANPQNGNALAPTYRLQSWQFGFGINI